MAELVDAHDSKPSNLFLLSLILFAKLINKHSNTSPTQSD